MSEELHVLVVDDSDDDREFYEELLDEDPNRSWRINGTSQSAEGLALAREHHFDCVLLDYSMPGRNGIEVVRSLREDNAEVPVVMLTGEGSERIAVEAMKAGVQDYLPKSELSTARLTEVILDAIEQQKKQLALMQRANYDHLTGLAGRALLLERLARAVSRSDRKNAPFGVLFIDLDGFKTVNDTLGHQAGDRLLKAVAQRMLAFTRDSDTVGRLGGDEFLVILEDLPDDGLAVTRALKQRLADTIESEPIDLAGRAVSIRASIGSAVYPTTTRDRQELLERADAAMYEAKQSGLRVRRSGAAPERSDRAQGRKE